jgi:glycosyltransferase involved in cell wall biosynthesis
MIQSISFYVPFRDPAFLEDWSVCETKPLGGSETAALRMATAFQAAGLQVKLASDIQQFQDGECDVFVALRDWGIFVDHRLPGRLNYLWCQDDANQYQMAVLKDKELANQVYSPLARVMMLSSYQANGWTSLLNLPVDKVFLTTNGVPRHLFSATSANLTDRPARAYYSSTPYRGLDVLLETWPYIRQAVPDAELLIYSSMNVYHKTDKPVYEELYTRARSLPGVTYIGSVGQKELRDAAQTCRVLAYPCTFPETSCITAMEAMASGCVVASTAIGALPETAWQNPLVVPNQSNWPMVWAETVARLLVDDAYYEAIARQNLATSRLYDWNLVAQRWVQQFQYDEITLL